MRRAPKKKAASTWQHIPILYYTNPPWLFCACFFVHRRKCRRHCSASCPPIHSRPLPPLASGGRGAHAARLSPSRPRDTRVHPIVLRPYPASNSVVASAPLHLCLGTRKRASEPAPEPEPDSAGAALGPHATTTRVMRVGAQCHPHRPHSHSLALALALTLTPSLFDTRIILGPLPTPAAITSTHTRTHTYT